MGRNSDRSFQGATDSQSNGMPVAQLILHRSLEVEADLSRQSTRRNVMRAAEGGEEVVQSVFVGNVDACQTEAPFVFVAMEEVVLTDRSVEEVSVFNAGRIVVIVAGAGSRDGHQL